MKQWISTIFYKLDYKLEEREVMRLMEDFFSYEYVSFEYT